MRLAEQATSPRPRVRQRAAAAAAELLPLLGLAEGRYAADGTWTGGSPDFADVASRLPAEARTAVAVLGLVADPAVLPSGLPTTGATVWKVLTGGGVAATAAGATAAMVGLAGGDAGRVVTAGITAGAALVGHAVAARADRQHARLAELLRAAADVRRGLPADAVAVHDRAVADALHRVSVDRDGTLSSLEALAEIGARAGADSRPGPRAVMQQRLAGITPAATAGRRDRVPGGSDRAAQLAVPRPVAPDATPSGRAWARRTFAGPLANATVAGVGLLVATAAGWVAVSAATIGTLGAGLAAAGLLTAVEHAQARRRAALEGRRTDLEDARRRARAAAEDAARSASGRASDADVEARTRRAERVARRLDALLADAAAGGRPVLPADLAAELAGEQPGAVDPAPTGAGPVDQLVPGARTGPLEPGALTAADRAGVEDLGRALETVDAARGRARTAAVGRARQLAAHLGLDAPAVLDTDPDALGWPHRRAALDPALQLRLAALDELPSAVPGPGWAVTKGLAGVVVPSVTAAVLGAATLGVVPAVGFALGATGLAVSASLAERATAVAKERGKRPGTLWSAAATAALDAADAERAAARASATSTLAEQQAENRSRAARVAAGARRPAATGRRLPRTVPAAPPAPTPAATVSAELPSTATTPSSTPTPVAGRPGFGAALARAAGPAVLVVGGAAGLAAATTDVAPLVLVLPATWHGLAAPVLPVVGAAAAAGVAALASVVATVGDTVARRSGFDHEAARATAVEARRTRWAGVARAAAQAALDEAQARADAELADARADLAAARGRLDDAVTRSRRPRLLQLVLDRAAALVASVESALGRSTTPDPVTDARELALLARRAEELRVTAPDVRAERVDAVLADARRLGLLDPGPDAARRRTALPAALASISGALVGSAVAVGHDEQLWRWVRTVANATGWWPEEACDCPPGRPCLCTPPTPAALPSQAPTPATPTPTPAPPPTPAAQAPTPADPAPAGPPSVTPPVGRPPLPYAPPPSPAAPGGASPHGAPAPLPAPQVAAVVDVDDWPDGTGRTTAAVVTVVAPGGSQVDLLVRWVDPGRGQRPVLVLSDVPGSSFWWGVPAAVLQAAVQALGALRPPAGRLDHAVVVGQRGGREPLLSELPVTLGGAGPQLVPGRGPRQLPPAEAGAATAALRLRPVADLLGRLRPVRAGS